MNELPVQRIALVEHEQTGFGFQSEIGERSIDGLHLARPVRIGRIGDVHELIGVVQLFERRAKRVHQVFRQIGNETHGVDHANVVLPVQPHSAHCGVQRRERLVGDERVGARQTIEQR